MLKNLIFRQLSKVQQSKTLSAVGHHHQIREKSSSAAIAPSNNFSESRQTKALDADKNSNDAELEWQSAKPFNKIPGHRSLPLLGTTWVTMPLIGNTF